VQWGGLQKSLPSNSWIQSCNLDIVGSRDDVQRSEDSGSLQQLVKRMDIMLHRWRGSLWRGLLTAWSPHLKTSFTLSLPLGIVVQVFDSKLNYSFKLLNVYGPYSNRSLFWDVVNELGQLNSEDIILEGDLNFTTSLKKVWGKSLAKIHRKKKFTLDGETSVN
jgi:hypothetical protein